MKGKIMSFMKKSLSCENDKCRKHCKSSEWEEVQMPDGYKKALCKDCANIIKKIERSAMKTVLLVMVMMLFMGLGYSETAKNSKIEKEQQKIEKKFVEESKMMNRDLIEKRIAVLEDVKKKDIEEYNKIAKSLTDSNTRLQELTQRVLTINGGIAELQLAIGIDPNPKKQQLVKEGESSKK
jgi:hypothetical protein